MYFCKFKAGEIVLGVETPEMLEIKEPYSIFLCEDEQVDVMIKFSYTSKIEKGQETVIKETPSLDISEDAENYYFYYHILGENKYYALRKVKKSESKIHDIFIPEEYIGKIWTRLVFTLVNFDDVASEFGAAVFHASYIEYNSEAILFTAPCGTGKSTQADLWHKYRNAEIINGDKALIYEKNGQFFASGLPFSGSSNICKNAILPIKAIVRLGQAKKNILSRLTGLRAYKAIFEGCYHSQWSADYNKSTSILAEKLAVGVPVFSLECLPDESAVEILNNNLAELNYCNE